MRVPHTLAENAALDRTKKPRYLPGTTARNPVRNLEKQYEELCRLREQVQIAESRQRVLSHGLSHDARR